MQKITVLVVDDEDDIRDLIVHTLGKADCAVMTARDGQEGFVQALGHRPNLVLIDWMMPVVNGMELLQRLRRDERTRDIPVIMLSAKSEIDNKTQGLDSGADDYLAKPFSPKELIARIKAVLRRSESRQGTDNVLRCRELTLDADSHHAAIHGQPINLGPTEFRLLHFFMSHPDRVYTRGQLLDKVWGNAVYIDERTVDVHIRRLRKALQTDGHDTLIQTVRSAGYRFSDKG